MLPDKKQEHLESTQESKKAKRLAFERPVSSLSKSTRS